MNSNLDTISSSQTDSNSISFFISILLVETEWNILGRSSLLTTDPVVSIETCGKG